MAKQTTRLQIKRRKFNPFATVVTLKQQVKKITGVKVTKADIVKCWHDELTRIKTELLENGHAKIPCNIGSLNIFKFHASELSSFKLKAISKSEINLARLDYVYDIVFLKSDLVNKKVRFIPCSEIVNKKKEIIKNTNKDYKPAPLKNIA